ncbi:MAG: hypothetical protein WBE37_31135 [Bryobacteraceae bacterium]
MSVRLAEAGPNERIPKIRLGKIDRLLELCDVPIADLENGEVQPLQSGAFPSGNIGSALIEKDCANGFSLARREQ